MSYDTKFKARALSWFSGGRSRREVARGFGISRNTLIDWEARASSGEGLAPRKRNRKHWKIPPQRLRELMAETPDAYNAELSVVFGCSQSAVWYALRRLGFTSKKKLPPSKSATRDCAKPSPATIPGR